MTREEIRDRIAELIEKYQKSLGYDANDGLYPDHLLARAIRGLNTIKSEFIKLSDLIEAEKRDFQACQSSVESEQEIRIEIETAKLEKR